MNAAEISKATILFKKRNVREIDFSKEMINFPRLAISVCINRGKFHKREKQKEYSQTEIRNPRVREQKYRIN